MTSSCRSITSSRAPVFGWLVFVTFGMALAGCASSPDDDPYNQILHGAIDYPFVDETAPLGKNGPEERFVIRSAVGQREYTIEIPGAAEDYDVEIPLAQIDPEKEGAIQGAPDGLSNPVTTDKELVAELPSLSRRHPTDTALLDEAFGVGEGEGPKQAPSYSVGIAKVNGLYKKRQYEYALVELNTMLAFYPNSPKLLKMKGTVLVKMRQLTLAERTWTRAADLKPDDQPLQQALASLRNKIGLVKGQDNERTASIR